MFSYMICMTICCDTMINVLYKTRYNRNKCLHQKTRAEGFRGSRIEGIPSVVDSRAKL